jgi:glutamine synthetase
VPREGDLDLAAVVRQPLDTETVARVIEEVRHERSESGAEARARRLLERAIAELEALSRGAA